MKTKQISLLVLVSCCVLTLAEEQKTATLNELAGRYIVGNPPAAKDISLQEYKALVAKYSQNENRRVKVKDGDWRAYELVLDSFDDTWAYCGVVTQHKSKSWSWVERYRLSRDAETDKVLSLSEIIERRTRVVGGIMYGMTVDQVIEKKGRHFRINSHQAAGSADLVYDDVKVSVRDWWGNDKGRVVSVDPITEGLNKQLSRIPYKDEKPVTDKRKEIAEPEAPR